MHTEDALHTLGIGDARYDSLACNIRIILLHIKTHVVHRRLGLVDKHQSLGFEECNLLYHLRTYRTSSSRDEYNLILQKSAYCLHINLNLVARQQVLNIHLPHLQVYHLALAVPLLSLGHHHYLHARLRKTIHQILILAESLGTHRTDKQRAHTLSLHVSDESAIPIIHVTSQQELASHILFIGNKSTHHISRGMLVAY